MGDLSALKVTEQGQEVVRPFSAYNLKRNDTVLATDNAPYLFRKALSILNASPYVREKLVGGSVAWNQLVKPVSTGVTSNDVVFTVNNGKIVANGLSSNRSDFQFQDENISAIKNHVYYLYGCPIGGGESKYRLFVNDHSEAFPYGNRLQDTGNGVLRKALATATVVKEDFYVHVFSGAGQVTNLTFIPQFIDLTQAFGTQIADHIYSLEQATAGAGIAKLKEWGFFNKPYYEYNDGEIKSVFPFSKKIVGFNQWDEVYEAGGIVGNTGEPTVIANRIRSRNFCPCVPNLEYYVNLNFNVVLRIFWYDSEKNFIKYDGSTNKYTCTSPSNAAYFKVSTEGSTYGEIYRNDICINISDTSKNGRYESYHKTTILLGSDELRGVLKLDANNNLHYDGDVKNPDGSIDRKYGIVDFGDLIWKRSTYSGVYFFAANITGCIIQPSSESGKKPICSAYVSSSPIAIANMSDKTICYKNDSVGVYVRDDSFNDVNAFTTAMTGKEIVFELDTPTTEQSTPYTDPQMIFAGGTESFIDALEEAGTRDVAIPVGHETQYMGASSTDKFYLPTFPQNDGEYLMKVTRESGIVTDARWTDELQTYSTEETKIGTWIDGKTVYRRVVVLPSSVTVPNNTWTTIYTDAFIGNISQIITANYVNTSNGGAYNFFYMKPSGNDLQYYFPGSGNLSLESGVAFVITYIKS